MFSLMFYFIILYYCIFFFFFFCRRNAGAGQNFRYNSEFSPLRLFGLQGRTLHLLVALHLLEAIKRGLLLIFFQTSPQRKPCTSPSTARPVFLPCHTFLHFTPYRTLTTIQRLSLPCRASASPLPHTQASSHGSHTRRTSIQARSSDPYPCQRWGGYFQGCRRPLSSSGSRGTP